MHPAVRPLLLMTTLAGVTAAWEVWPRATVRAVPGAAATERAEKTVGPQLQGVASCAATSCHNANGPSGSKGSEYSTWAAYDPHARAYRVLFEERSVRMAKHLKLAEGRPEKAELCLNCHVHPD